MWKVLEIDKMLKLLCLVIMLICLTACGSPNRQEEQELQRDLQRYLEVSNTVSGQRDRDVMREIATGSHFEHRWQLRCKSCIVQVWITGQIIEFSVMEYNPTMSKVRVRVEWAWHDVDSDTGKVIGPCVAQAYTYIYILAREDGIWKVSDTELPTLAARKLVDNTPELNAKYCKG